MSRTDGWHKAGFEERVPCRERLDPLSLRAIHAMVSLEVLARIVPSSRAPQVARLVAAALEAPIFAEASTDQALNQFTTDVAVRLWDAGVTRDADSRAFWAAIAEAATEVSKPRN